MLPLKTSRFKLVIMLLLLLSSAACSNQDKYLGEWVGVETPTDFLNVTREGDITIIEIGSTAVMPVFGGVKMPVRKFPADYADDKLRVNGLMGGLTISYDRAADQLVAAAGGAGVRRFRRK